VPSSRYDLIPKVLDIVIQQKPHSILDIGIGYGKYGMLFREYLDIWDVKTPYSERKLKLYGVEAFKEYDNPIWQVYDNVLTKDVLSILPVLSGLGKFDLLFLGDVIEHLTKEEGKKILTEIEYDKLIIITPKVVSVQDAVYGNPFEIHKSSWSEKDFPDMFKLEINNQQIFWN